MYVTNVWMEVLWSTPLHCSADLWQTKSPHFPALWQTKALLWPMSPHFPADLWQTKALSWPMSPHFPADLWQSKALSWPMSPHFSADLWQTKAISWTMSPPFSADIFDRPKPKPIIMLLLNHLGRHTVLYSSEALTSQVNLSRTWEKWKIWKINRCRWVEFVPGWLGRSQKVPSWQSNIEWNRSLPQSVCLEPEKRRHKN